MFGPKGPFCQSCGMPLGKDPEGGGTEANGARSAEYCSHCYRAGQFTEPDITASQMVSKVEGSSGRCTFPAFWPGASRETSRRFAGGSLE